MKTKEELEQTARDIITVEWDLGIRKQSHIDMLVADLTKCLTRVQDEALNSVLPSMDKVNEEIARWEFNFPPFDFDFWGDGFRDCYRWLRANMEPAPEKK